MNYSNKTKWSKLFVALLLLGAQTSSFVAYAQEEPFGTDGIDIEVPAGELPDGDNQDPPQMEPTEPMEEDEPSHIEERQTEKYENEIVGSPTVNGGDVTLLVEIKNPADRARVGSEEASIESKDNRYYVYFQNPYGAYESGDVIQITVEENGESVELEPIKVSGSAKEAVKIDEPVNSDSDSIRGTVSTVSGQGDHYLLVSIDHSETTREEIDSSGQFEIDAPSELKDGKELEIVYEYEGSDGLYNELNLDQIINSKATSTEIESSSSNEDSSDREEQEDDDDKNPEDDKENIEDQQNDNQTPENDQEGQNDNQAPENDHDGENDGQDPENDLEGQTDDNVPGQEDVIDSDDSDFKPEVDPRIDVPDNYEEESIDEGIIENLTTSKPTENEVNMRLASDNLAISARSMSDDEIDDADYNLSLVPNVIRVSGINENGDSSEIYIDCDTENNEIYIYAQPLTYVSFFFGGNEIVCYTDQDGRAIYQPTYIITNDNSTYIINNCSVRYCSRYDVDYWYRCRNYWYDYGYWYGYNRGYNDNRDYSTTNITYNIVKEDDVKKQKKKDVPPRRKKQDLDRLPDAGEKKSIVPWIIGVAVIAIGAGLYIKSRNESEY